MRNDSAPRARADLYLTCEDVTRYLTERGMITPDTAEVLRRIAAVERILDITIHLSEEPSHGNDTIHHGPER